MEDSGRAAVEYQKLITVDGETYKLHVFMPSKAFKLGARVAKLLGEPVVAMSKASGDESKVGDAMAHAVKSLMSNLHEDEVWVLINDLLACVSFENKSISVDNHFKGRLGHLLKVVSEIIQFQFKDFFAAIGQAIAGATKSQP